MRTYYTHEEKLQHLKDAYEFVRAGKGSYLAYTELAGVSRHTYYNWVKKHSGEAGIPVRGRKNSPTQSLVAIGTPRGGMPVGGNHLCIEFFEARINVHSQEELLTVLRAVKKASI